MVRIWCLHIIFEISPNYAMVSLFKSKYNWHTVSFWFQVYITAIWYLYTFLNGHHGKLSYRLSLYKVITIFLTIVPMLYITSPWLIYFITGILNFLIPFICFVCLPNPFLLANVSLLSVSVSLFLFYYVGWFVLFFKYHI